MLHNSYLDISTAQSIIKYVVIRGYAGCGKFWTIVYRLLYAVSQGILYVMLSMMCIRAVYLGGKHMNYIFCLQTRKF